VVEEAAAALLLAYLEACLDRSSGGREDVDTIDAYCLAYDRPPIQLNRARDALKAPLLVSPERTRAELRRSVRLRHLADDIAKRSKSLRKVLDLPDGGPEGG
jgi:hypothetical protein